MKRTLASKKPTPTSLLRIKNRAALSAVSVAIFLLSCSLSEFNAPKYGASGFGMSLPGAAFLTRLVSPLYVAAVGIATFLVINRIGSSKRGLPENRSSSLPSQLAIWTPYAFVWTLSVFFGGVSGVDIFAWVSLAVVVGVACLRFPTTSREAATLALSTSRVLVWGSLAVALLSHARAFAPYSVWPGGWWPGVDRLQGLLAHPNTLGWIAAVCVTLELYCSRASLRVLTVLAAFSTLLLTGSRTASIALVIGLGFGLLHRIRRKSANANLAVVAIGSIGVILGVATLLVTGVSVDVLNGRSVTWSQALLAFKGNWILGSGPGAYLQTESAVASVAYAHNQLLQSAAESGVFGVAALAVHVIYLVVYIRRYASNSLGVTLAVMWFSMFLSENLLRFAAPNFVLQILVFQLGLFAATSYSKWSDQVP